MLCTIITQNGSDELMYGKQEFTWVMKPRFFEVSEALINEVRECAVDEIQKVIGKIKVLCPEIF